MRRRYRFGPGSVVIVEGVLLYRDPIDRYFDYRIHLEISLEEMYLRVEARDVPRSGPQILERYRTRYVPAHQAYRAAWRPRERADLVIQNDDPTRPVIVRPEGSC